MHDNTYSQFDDVLESRRESAEEASPNETFRERVNEHNSKMSTHRSFVWAHSHRGHTLAARLIGANMIGGVCARVLPEAQLFNLPNMLHTIISNSRGKRVSDTAEWEQQQQQWPHQTPRINWNGRAESISAELNDSHGTRIRFLLLRYWAY